MHEVLDCLIRPGAPDRAGPELFGQQVGVDAHADDAVSGFELGADTTGESEESGQVAPALHGEIGADMEERTGAGLGDRVLLAHD